MRELLTPHQPIRYRAADFLALWRCDEASGSIVDVTGTYTASVVSGSVGAASSLFASPAGSTGSRTFASSRATAAGTADARAALLGEWTISAWVRPDTISGGDRWMVTYAGGNTLASLVIRASGAVSTVWRTSSLLVVATSTTTLAEGSTYHVVAVKEADPANAGRYRVRFYVNGQDAGITSNLQNADGGTTSPQWSIGTDGSGSQPFIGSLDDVAVLRYAATAEAARSIYARGASSVDAATVYASDSYTVLTRATVYTASGSGVDLSSVYGWDLVRSVRIDDDVDAQGATADVEIVREVYEVNVAPLMATSAPNVDAGGALLALNRRLTVETATLPDGATAGAALVWDLVFDGFISGIDYADDVVSVSAQDRILGLQDVWVEPDRSTTPPRDRVYGSNSGTLDVQVEIQQLINDNVPPTVGYVGGTPLIYVPTSPAWGMNETTTASQTNVAGQIDEWVSQIGWLCRYRWDDVRRQYRLTLYEPDRTKTVADAQIPPSQVYSYSSLEIRRDDIRNVCDVEYGEALNSSGQPVTTDNTGQWKRAIKSASDATSIAKYGRRYCRIGIATASEINDAASAQRLANAVVADLKEPKASAEIEVRYRHHVEIGDVLLLLLDGQRFSSDQTFAVVGIKHTLSADTRRTSIQLRAAAPVSRWGRWWDRLTSPGRIGAIGMRALAAPSGVTALRSVGASRVAWNPIANAGSRQYLDTEVHRSTSSGFTPSSSTLLATVRGVSSALFEHEPGATLYYKLLHRDRTGMVSAESAPVGAIADRLDANWIPPGWRAAVTVRQGSAQTASWTAATDVRLANMTTLELDEGGLWDADPARQLIVAQAAGVYLVTASVAVNYSAGEGVQLRLYINNVATNFRSGYASVDGVISGTWLVSLAFRHTCAVYLSNPTAKPATLVTVPSATFISGSFLFPT